MADRTEVFVFRHVGEGLEIPGILKLKPATVRRMAALGQIGYHRLNGKELRFTRGDLDELLVRTRIEAREGA